MSNIDKEIKNYIHNDLKITKEYIQDIIKRTVTLEIRKILNNKSYIDTLIQKEINYAIRNEDRKYGILGQTLYNFNNLIENKVTATIVKEVKDKLIIKLSDNKEVYDE